MEITYAVRKPGNSTLLLFFSGWGTTPEVVAHMALPSGWDFCAFHDYRDLSTDLPIFSGYEHVYLAAWSMGVWAADALRDRLPDIARAVAVNGTALPMHDRYGIPISIFLGTLRGLDEVSRDKFDQRMAGGKKLLAVYKSFHARPTDELKEELQGVYDRVKGFSDVPDVQTSLSWSKALVSGRDLIIPPANQLAFWTEVGVPCIQLEDAGHYPFLSFSSWEELFTLNDR